MTDDRHPIVAFADDRAPFTRAGCAAEQRYYERYAGYPSGPARLLRKVWNKVWARHSSRMG